MVVIYVLAVINLCSVYFAIQAYETISTCYQSKTQACNTTFGAPLVYATDLSFLVTLVGLAPAGFPVFQQVLFVVVILTQLSLFFFFFSNNILFIFFTLQLSPTSDPDVSGRYLFSYSVTIVASYTLFIRYQGIDIPGSPFSVTLHVHASLLIRMQIFYFTFEFHCRFECLRPRCNLH